MSERTHIAAEPGQHREARYILETLQAAIDAIKRRLR